jgi:calcineurin-like phosphoesterase family protein
MNHWFFSDPHYGHCNIVKGSTKWADTSECRDFPSINKHDDFIVNAINNVVGQDDILYCLGDWALGGDDSIWKFRRRLNVRTLHLILGNHDVKIKRNKILTTDKGLINARDLFTSVQEVLEKDIGKTKLFMSHYSHRTWHKAHKGAIHLYGHSHGNLPDLYKSMDVHLFSHPERRPYHLDEIRKIMSTRENIPHHDRPEDIGYND